MRHVIIGSGPAGIIAAETIRKHGPADDIIVIGEEDEPPYARMAIPNFLMNGANEAQTWLHRDADWYARMRISLLRGRAVHVSTRTRSVKMEDGSAIAFDKLLIASGAAPRIPVIPGIDLPGVHACWTLDDARRIDRLARPGARVVVIGGGFIGCIVMEALRARGVQLTVVERRDRILPSMMGKRAGEMVQRWCESRGVRVHAGARVTGIGSTEMASASSPRVVRLSNRQQLLADLIVYSVGTSPNISFLKGSGIRCMQGVVVDASMRTNVPGIYAAGDCAESFDSVAGRSVIAGVQPNAADQAYCAALNMTGRHAFQRGVRQIDVVDTLGLISSSFGNWQGVRGGQWVEMADERNFRYLRLEFFRDVLIGCNTVGITEHATVLRSLIWNHVHLGEWKDRLMQDPTRLKDAYVACVEQQYVDEASWFHQPMDRRPEAIRQAV